MDVAPLSKTDCRKGTTW